MPGEPADRRDSLASAASWREDRDGRAAGTAGRNLPGAGRRGAAAGRDPRRHKLASILPWLGHGLRSASGPAPGYRPRGYRPVSEARRHRRRDGIRLRSRGGGQVVPGRRGSRFGREPRRADARAGAETGTWRETGWHVPGDVPGDTPWNACRITGDHGGARPARPAARRRPVGAAANRAGAPAAGQDPQRRRRPSQADRYDLPGHGADRPGRQHAAPHSAARPPRPARGLRATVGLLRPPRDLGREASHPPGDRAGNGPEPLGPAPAGAWTRRRSHSRRPA